MNNKPAKIKKSLKALFFMIIAAAGLFVLSCSNGLSTKGSVSFTIPQAVVKSIAARAGEDASEQPGEVVVNLEVSLYKAEDNSLIETAANQVALKVLVDNPESQKFTFNKLSIGTQVYAKAIVSIMSGEQSTEICSGQSETAAVEQGTTPLTIKLVFSKKDLAYYLNEPVQLDLILKNTDTTVRDIIPSVSLYCIEPESTLLSNDATGYANIDNPQAFIELMDDTTSFLGTFKAEPGENNTLKINASISQSKKFAIDSKAYIFAVANYDNRGHYDPSTPGGEDGILSFRGVTAEPVTVGPENAVEVEVERKDIPCKISYYKCSTTNDVEYLNLTEYISLPFYNYNDIMESEIKGTYYNKIDTICPGETDSSLFFDFNNNYVTAKVYFGLEFSGQGNININPNTTILDIKATVTDKNYLNKLSIDLGAIVKSTGADVSNNTQIIWEAKLLYGGVDINEYGIEYYTLNRDINNKWSLQTTRSLDLGGTYQLYVEATYEGVKNSMMMNVPVENSLLYEYDVESPDYDDFYDFSSQLNSDMSNLSAQGHFVIKGTLEDDYYFGDIVSSLNYAPQYNISVDLSELEGGPTDFSSGGTSFKSSHLTSIILPGNISKLGISTFEDCPKLQSITVPGDITTIEGGFISNCPSITEIKFTGTNSKYSVDSTGCLYETDGADKILIYASPAFLQNPSFASNGITKIGSYVFYKTELFVALDLTGVNAISEYSFKNAKIPSIASFGNVTSIPERAFYSADIAGNIDFTGITSIGDYAFYQTNYSGAVDFTGITSLGSYAFAYSTITSITSFGTIDPVPDYAFQSCEALTTVNLNGVTTVGQGAFYGCSSLTTLQNYDSLKEVKVGAFRSCNIESFVLKEGLTIGTNGFSSGVQTLVVDYALDSTDAINLFKSGLSPYFYRVQHIIFNEKVVIPDLTVSGISADTGHLPATNFENKNSFLYQFTSSTNTAVNIQSIEFKGDDSSIGKNQFINYKQLTEVKFTGNNISIGELAFYGCSSLSSIDLTGVTNIGEFAFGNTGLEFLNFSTNENLTVISSYAFFSCKSLASVIFGSTITTIGSSAFESSGLQLLDFSLTAVTSIGNSAFFKCNLNLLNLGNKITKIGAQAFYDAFSDGYTITIPASTFAIGRNSFYTHSGTPNLTIAHSEATETWYSCDNSTFDNMIMGTSLGPGDNIELYSTKIGTGNYDSDIISSLTAEGSSGTSYLRKVEN